MQEKKLIDSIKIIESNKNQLQVVEDIQSDIDTLKDQFYEMDYYNGKNRSFFQRFISRLPSIYILFKMYKTGLKNSLVNIRGYRTIKKNNLFDLGYYLKNNDDIRILGIDPILHYIYHGFKEGRTPNLTFDGAYYLK